MSFSVLETSSSNACNRCGKEIKDGDTCDMLLVGCEVIEWEDKDWEMEGYEKPYPKIAIGYNYHVMVLYCNEYPLCEEKGV